MKLVTYVAPTPFGEVDRLGALDGERIVDLSASFEAHMRDRGSSAAAEVAPALVPPSLIGLLRREDRGMEHAREALEFARATGAFSLPAAGARLRAPLPRPNSIRDFMLVEEHVRNSGLELPQEWYEIPAYWKGNPDTVFGPGDEIRWPEYTEKLDYELEMALVIGRRAHRVSAEDAPAHVAGYTIFNDWSARDIQFREMAVGIGPAFGKDFATSLGPCLTTADALDVGTVRLAARINGETWSEGDLGAMNFSFPEVISLLSQDQPLQPGDVLGGGTVGRGCGLELDRWIAPGDVVELEVEGIGILRNTVGAKQDAGRLAIDLNRGGTR
jgi:2-keto-4-pentenoate hydratase/2-oxohepta-3-ene-1,7-dioic acid hydratase in catechol pathway